jgi:hypothetical protein
MVAWTGDINNVSDREPVHGLAAAARSAVTQYANAVTVPLGWVVQQGILPYNTWGCLDIDMRAGRKWWKLVPRGIGKIERDNVFGFLPARGDAQLSRQSIHILHRSLESSRAVSRPERARNKWTIMSLNPIFWRFQKFHLKR